MRRTHNQAPYAQPCAVCTTMRHMLHKKKLHKKKRKAYFDKRNLRKVSDNKSFWKNIQPLLSENRKIRNKNEENQKLKISENDENENILSEEY